MRTHLRRTHQRLPVPPLRLTFPALAVVVALTGFVTGCQPEDHVNPDDPHSGRPPNPAMIYGLNTGGSVKFFDSNLRATNRVTATFAMENGVLVPNRVNQQFPAVVGRDANLLAGVGFGTYVNVAAAQPPVENWASDDLDPFYSELNASLVLNNDGDAVRFCRSFATTCVTVALDPQSPTGALAIITAAANLPDTEIGPISETTSAAIRGTGSAGLTIAITDPTAVAVPIDVQPGTQFTLTWTVARGDVDYSLDYSVAIDDAEVTRGNTMGLLADAIVKEAGVALMFPTAVTTNSSYELDYSYSFGEQTGNFEDNLGFGVDLSPQLDLGYAPVYLYPTYDIPGAELLTLSGQGVPHAVQPTDGIVGAIGVHTGISDRTVIYSTEFNGDDFVDTPFDGLADFGITGGGFYPSPTLCYAQAFPVVQGNVAAGVRREVHRLMYANVANGIAAVDEGLATAAAGLSLPYDRVGNIGSGDIQGYIAIGTDYADNNVDAAITTSAGDTYQVTLTSPAAVAFRDQLNAIVAGLGGGAPASLLRLAAGLNTPPGVQDGVVGSTGEPIFDDEIFDLNEDDLDCRGYDCQVRSITKDVINARNDFPGSPPSNGVPALAAACLWGLGPADPVPERPATLSGNPGVDHPLYPEVPARPAIPPVREQAAASINAFVMGAYGNFINAAFGPKVPASNFSLLMQVGDTTGDSSPEVHGLTISRQP